MQYPYRLAVIATLVGTIAGCHSLGLREANQPFAEIPLGDTPMKAVKEMPARDAAKVCLATARKMDEGGRDAEAIGMYLRAREHDSSVDVSARLAVLYDRLGQTSEALTEYRRALEKQPKHADLWNDFGYYYLSRENYAEAEKCFRRSLELKPKHAQATNNLALTLGYQKRYQECYAIFEKSIGVAAAHSNLGMILAQHQSYDEAAVEFRAALAEQPGLKQAQQMLAHLENDDTQAIAANP
jgi:Tfp pilus assembly protein PilF